MHAIYPGLEEYAVSDLSNTMLRYSSSVFNLCGVSPAANGTGPQVPTKDIVPQLNSPTLNAQLRRIAEATAKIARVTREDILSTTFEVILVNPSSSFDEVGMINAFREIHFGSQVSSPNGNGSATPASGVENEKQSKGGSTKPTKNGTTVVVKNQVLCTTELGLRCVTRKGQTSLENGASVAEEAQSSDLFETRVLLAPKVVLDSAVKALD